MIVTRLTLLIIPALAAGVKVVVKEDSDAVLPCLISTKENITAKVFDWKKDDQKEVFFYDSGIHYSNGRSGQDEQFKGRVSHFQDQLMNGNASIKIQNTRVTDSGNYSCIFPKPDPRQTFYIELVVGLLLRDRSGEIPGASKPIITRLDAIKDGLLLQCEVQGASPEPKVELQDGSGNILPAEEPQVSERGGSYYVTLKTTVTTTDRYRCVATQEDISHQSSAETFLFISEKQDITPWIGGIVISVVLLAAVLAVPVVTKCVTVTCNREICKKRLSGPTGQEAELNSNDPEKGTLMTPATNISHSTAGNGLMVTFTNDGGANL